MTSKARLRVWTLAIGITSATLVAAQQGRSGTASTSGAGEIAGTVVTDDTAPIALRRATVTLSNNSNLVLIAVTEDNGTFTFAGLPDGQFMLSASKGGYLPANYGARRPAGVGIPVVLVPGQRASGIVIKMTRGSVVTGIVTGEDGQPVPDVAVQAYRRVFSEKVGRRALEAAPFAKSLVTDDRGRYRIWGLEAGEYAVVARLPSRFSSSSPIEQVKDADVRRAQRLLLEPVAARATGATIGTEVPQPSRVAYAPVFFPSAVTEADATVFVVGPHEERDGINIQLRAVPTATVSVLVSGPDGAPLPRAILTMMDPGPLPPGFISLAYRNGITDKDGRFSMLGIPPGTYAIFADTANMMGRVSVSVAGRDVDALVAMRPNLTLSGRLVFEGGSPRPRSLLSVLPPMTLGEAGPGSGWVGAPKVSEDGSFTVTVRGGTYRVGSNLYRSPSVVEGWTLKSVVINGANVEDVTFPITDNVENVAITLTDQLTEISGVLQDTAGNPVTDYVLLAFSADQRFRLPQSRRTQEARPEANGHFSIRNLPAGDYLMVALADVLPSEWNDPDFLATLAAQSPTKITLAEGEKKIQNVTVRK